jgi:hypothetical protein
MYSILGTNPDKKNPRPSNTPPIKETFRKENFLLSKLAIGPEKQQFNRKVQYERGITLNVIMKLFNFELMLSFILRYAYSS